MFVFSALALAQQIAAAVCAPFGNALAPVLSPSSLNLPAPGISQMPTLLDFYPPTVMPGTASGEWGKSIHSDPGEFHRIYFQNLDGMRNEADEIDLYVASMAQFKVGTFCWADPSLDFSNLPVRKLLQRTIHSHFRAARTAQSSSKLPPSSFASKASAHQPGGTFMASTGRWATRSYGNPLVDSSGMGRWSGLCFLGKRGKRLAILTAYRSPRQQHTGGFGFYDQQHSLLLAKGVAKPNVRKQFIIDFVSEINRLQNDRFEVVVSLDANETLGQDKLCGIEFLISECNLHDLHLSGPSEPPETYKYGHQRRIDYMLGSDSVLEAVHSAGYLAYNNGIFSKHRGLFIDLDFHQLMGSVDAIESPKARGINSEDQPAVDRYLTAFKKNADDHKIWTRVTDLGNLAPFLSTMQIKTNFDAVDRDVTRGMLYAEKQAKKPASKFAWSPQLREAGLLSRYWNLRRREVEHGHDLQISLSSLLLRFKTLNIVVEDATCTDALTIKDHWKKAIKRLRTVREAAYDHRAVHLQAMLTQYQHKTFAPDDDHLAAENKEKIYRIRRLINNENMRKPYRNIHASVTSFTAGSLSKLFVPSHALNMKVAAKFCDPDRSVNAPQLIEMAQYDKHSVAYNTILDCDAIEGELLRYNRLWFRQASETPFGHGELFDLVGEAGLTEEATAIVSGDCISYMGIEMSRELQIFLEECKRPSTVNIIEHAISRADFTKAVKDWKESTSTSPSGRHLGHYRTAILDADVTGLHTDLLNIPIEYGFAPERWTHSVTPLIEKDAGHPYLTRLHVIHLFEADYNLFLKLVYGWRMVQNAEKANALNDQQHGSRPRRMTTDALFYLVLKRT